MTFNTKALFLYTPTGVQYIFLIFSNINYTKMGLMKTNSTSKIVHVDADAKLQS